MNKQLSILIGVILLFSTVFATNCGNLKAYSINSSARQGESLYYSLDITNNYSYYGTITLKAQTNNGLETVFERNNFNISGLSSKTINVVVNVDKDTPPGEKLLTFTSTFNGNCSQSDTRTAQIYEQTNSNYFEDPITNSNTLDYSNTMESTLKDSTCKTTFPKIARTYEISYINNGNGGDFDIITNHDPEISIKIDADPNEIYSFNKNEKKTITAILTPDKEIQAGTYIATVALKNKKSNIIVARNTLCMTVNPTSGYFTQFTPETISIKQGTSNTTNLYLKNNSNSDTYFVILPKDEFVEIENSQFTLKAGKDTFIKVTVNADKKEKLGDKQINLTIKGNTITKTISATAIIKESNETLIVNDKNNKDTNPTAYLPDLDLNYTIKKSTIDGEINQILVLFEITNNSVNSAKNISIEINGIPENWETLVSRTKISIDPYESKEFSVAIIPKKTKEKFFLEAKLSTGIEKIELATKKIELSNKKELPGIVPITGNIITLELPPLIGFIIMLVITLIGIRAYLYMQQQQQKDEIKQLRNILKKTKTD